MIHPNLKLMTFSKVRIYITFNTGTGTNLWQGILNGQAQRDDVRESHLIVLGDRGAGKRSLIN
jgi:hypothetical protein